MTLSEWLRSKNRTPSDFADEIGVNKSTISRAIRGERLPDRDTMRRIYKGTDGEVTANDFYGHGEAA